MSLAANELLRDSGTFLHIFLASSNVEHRLHAETSSGLVSDLRIFADKVQTALWRTTGPCYPAADGASRCSRAKKLHSVSASGSWRGRPRGEPHHRGQADGRGGGPPPLRELPQAHLLPRGRPAEP